MTSRSDGYDSTDLLLSIVRGEARSASPTQLDIPIASNVEDAALLADLEKIHSAWNLVDQVEPSSSNLDESAFVDDRLDDLMQVQSAVNAAYTRLIQYLLEQNQWLTSLVGELEATVGRPPKIVDDDPSAK